MLSNWNKISFQSKTRRGMATETVYFNYEPPIRLHDYRYFGDNFKQREHYKLKRNRLVAKFAKMSEQERIFYAHALVNEFDDIIS